MDATKMFTEDIPSDIPENRVWASLSDVGNLTSDCTDPFGKIEAMSMYLRDTQIKTLFAMFGLLVDRVGLDALRGRHQHEPHQHVLFVGSVTSYFILPVQYQLLACVKAQEEKEK
jgi:hypothetical protein